MRQTASIQRPGFDPGAWLNTFRENGGYWFTIAGNVTVGILPGGGEAKQHAARQMLASVRLDPDARQAIRAHVLARAGET